MRSQKKTSRTSRLRPPVWLIEDQISKEGEAIRREWIERTRQAESGSGEARLAAAMTRLRTQRPKRPLLAQANTRALRWVDSAIRRGREAKKLQQVTPNLRLSQRLILRAHRVALPMAACFVLLLCKTGVFTMVEGTVRVADKLAKLHVDRHIGPPMA